MKETINILGTEYTIEKHKISEDETLKMNNWSGYCDEYLKKIVYADAAEVEYFQNMEESAREYCIKHTLRHEIFHAFLNESGLCEDANGVKGSWSRNEEMIDWLAIQSPKIFKVFDELGIL